MSNNSKWGLIVGLLFIGLFVFYFILANTNNLALDLILEFIIILIIYKVVKVFFEILNPHKKMKFKKIRKREITKEFKDAYKYVKKEYGIELEKERKKFLVSLIIAWTIFILLGIIAFVLIIQTENEIPEEVITLLFLPAFVYYYAKTCSYNKVYVKTYKNTIIRNFVKTINPDLYYEQDGMLGVMNTYLEAGFDDKDFKTFYADDHINGYTDNFTKIDLNNVTLGKANDENEFFEIIYEGIFSTTYLNYNLEESLKIKKNKRTIKRIKNKVLMDSREFEKYFDVYCDNNILAMKLLTHDIMEELVIFNKKFGVDLEIVIANNKIYTRFDTGMMFEPDIIRKAYNMKTLWLYYNILIFVTNVTIKLNKVLKDIEI